MLGPEQMGLKMLVCSFFTEDIADVNRRHAHLLGTNNPVKQACVDKSHTVHILEGRVHLVTWGKCVGFVAESKGSIGNLFFFFFW